MPVTIKVAKHDASPVRATPNSARNSVKVSQDALELLYHRDAEKIGPILKTALGPQTSLPDTQLEKMRLRVEDHGLVRAAYYAYSGHHHLVLRPEDIWFAILTQFSFYVNANSEKLRSSFASHKGKKGLILRDPAQPDMGLMCRNMTKLIDENIVDPKLRQWIMPSFTTTTINDEVVASIIMMGTLQNYFEYIFDCSCCGIPSVTLLGEVSDWVDIQTRIEKLNEYGKEPSQFCDLLRPVLSYMVASFTEGPGNPGVVDFWSRIIDRTSGSGMDYLDGWMVAFCFWDEDGKRLAKMGPNRSSSSELFNLPYLAVDFDQVPAGFVSVPVIYIPPGEDNQDVQIETKLLAGFVGYEEICHATHAVEVEGDAQAVEEHQKAGDTAPEWLDTLKPVTGWWMYEVAKGTKSGMSRKEFYDQKMEEWEGGASTGYVQRDGQIVDVKDGLPGDLFHGNSDDDDL